MHYYFPWVVDNNRIFAKHITPAVNRHLCLYLVATPILHCII